MNGCCQKVSAIVLNPHGSLLFQRAPDGEDLISEKEFIEQVCEYGEVETRRRNRRIHDEPPVAADQFKGFRATYEVTL